MTTISAKVIADSISPDRIRLTTMLLRYPRCIHSEFMTHRVFSRNASSSRAIPVQRLIQDVIDDPFIPLHWGKNQKGMQADEECEAMVQSWSDKTWGDLMPRERAWLLARDQAVYAAREFNAAGYHKQLVNRLLEPFAHINVVVTATEWSNFIALRNHEDAEPHICRLAQEMVGALASSAPKLLLYGEWHLPFVSDEEVTLLGSQGACIPLSVARCARTSYMTHDGRPPKLEEDLQLAARLLSSVPLHASPAEHQAQPDRCWFENAGPGKGTIGRWTSPHLHGNFRGWVQYRKTLPGECQ